MYYKDREIRLNEKFSELYIQKIKVAEKNKGRLLYDFEIKEIYDFYKINY